MSSVVGIEMKAIPLTTMVNDDTQKTGDEAYWPKKDRYDLTAPENI